MLKLRLAAALVLVPATAVYAGALSGSAAAVSTPASSGGGAPPPAPANARTSAAVMRVATIRHYGQPDNASGFSIIIATGARQAWAFGGTNPGGPSMPVAARWNGTTLTPSTLPAGLTGLDRKSTRLNS